MIRATITIALAYLLVASVAMAGNGIAVRPFSQQYSQSRAGAGARIDVHRRSAGRPAREPQPIARVAVAVAPVTRSRDIGGATKGALPGPLYPTLPSTSPIFKSPQPAGPGSVWYSDGAGHVCMYAPSSVLPCFTVTVAGNGGAAAAPLTPATIAAHVADRMSLSPGELKASPSNAGLTGAASWFWLDPAPTTEHLSVSLAGEDVTLTAVPRVTWQFGDGASIDGGAGIPYEPGAVPADAITHVYATRCLPGDQGRDPYVLASCGSDGYPVVAAVTWEISYHATGSVAASGTLPARTTTSSAAYPVSEARAFLVQGTAG